MVFLYLLVGVIVAGFIFAKISERDDDLEFLFPSLMAGLGWIIVVPGWITVLVVLRISRFFRKRLK